MNPTQRKIADLENRLDELESAFKVIDSKIIECEKDIEKINNRVMPLPVQVEIPKSIEFQKVLKSICELCKKERHITCLCSGRKGSDEYSLGKIAAIKVIRELTGLGLYESKKIVDEVWGTLKGEENGSRCKL
jgi:hypothetical protein